jgi:hypothetical protein
MGRRFLLSPQVRNLVRGQLRQGQGRPPALA